MFWTIVLAVIVALILYRIGVVDLIITAIVGSAALAGVVFMYVFRFLCAAGIGTIFFNLVVEYGHDICAKGSSCAEPSESVMLLIFIVGCVAGYLITQAICPSDKFKAKHQNNKHDGTK